MTTLRRIIGIGLLALGLWQNIPTQAQSIPSQDSAGALMWRSQTQSFLNRKMPYLFQPITHKDITPPDPAESNITIEDGVIPQQRSIQGILRIPGGKIYIGGPQDE